MPSIRPSRCFKSACTASVMAGLRKKAAINLALPSGSSPPEKPPGRNTIWLSPIRFASSFALSDTCAGVRLLMTNTSGCAPARSMARAESYSQFVPGNTGISTRGLAAPTFGATRVSALYVTQGTSSCRAGAW